jgi:hypothetical protein
MPRRGNRAAGDVLILSEQETGDRQPATGNRQPVVSQLPVASQRAVFRWPRLQRAASPLPVAGCLLPVSCLLFSCTASGGTPTSEKPASACPTGDVRVQVGDDTAALARCSTLGALAVGPSFTLRALTPLAAIEKTRSLDVSNNLALTGLFLPALVAVQGDLVIDNNAQVATVSLHRLVEVKGDLTVRDNRELVRLDLGNLRRVGGRLEISGHPALETVVLDRLERAADVVLDANPAWPPDDAAALARKLGRAR